MRNPECILVVDASSESPKVVANLLQPNYRVMVTAGGEAALRIAQGARRPDLILLDGVMPATDGFAVCEQLKAGTETRDIPVIFLVAGAAPDDEVRAFQVGAADVVPRPLNPPVLLARIKAQLALAAQRRLDRQDLRAADRRLVRVISERDRSEIERQRLHDRQQALLAVTRAALGDLTLAEYLVKTLEAIDAIPWLEIEPRGALFLFSRKNELILVAEHRLEEARDRVCPSAQLGRCVCRTAVSKTRPMFLTEVKGANEHCLMGRHGVGGYTLPLAEGNRLYGVLTVLAPPDHRPVESETQFMADVAQTFTTLIRRRIAEETLRISQVEIQVARNEVIRRLGIAAEFRDTETGLHVMRMSQYSRAIATALGCDPEYCELLELAASMHDVGKIGIHDDILRKPSQLTPEEFAIMQEHTLIGGRILEGDDPLIRLAREIALSHHERWDGAGYPSGLSGENIPLSGRICAVADVFDALLMDRPYKRPWSVEQAVDLISTSAGTAFDPDAVAAFQRCLPELLAIKARYHDGVIDPRELLPMTRASGEDVWIPWEAGFSTGIDIIDEHHRYLLDWTNRVHKAIHENAGTIEIAKALFALEQYTRIHFRAEERLMADYGCQDFEAHQRQHRAFEGELCELRAEIVHNPFIAGMEMQEYLRDWLLNHILKSDKQILSQINLAQASGGRSGG